MNNKTLFLIPLIFLFGKISAQNKLRIGLEAGANYSDIRLENGYRNGDLFNYDWGFVSGFTIEYVLSERISLGSGLSYERKTTSINASDLSAIDPYDPYLFNELSTNYNYLTLPILVRYKFIRSHNFFIQSGFYTSYLIKITDKLDGVSFENYVLTDRIDLGLVVRIGYAISIGNKSRLNIQVGDNLGFLADKLNSFNLLVGWDFQL